MAYSELYKTNLIILACQDNSIVLLGARFLTFLQKMQIQFHFSDIKLDIPDVEIISEQQSFFNEFSIDTIFTAGGSLFIGFNRGYVKEYSLKDFMVVRTYNPLHFIIQKEKLSKQTKRISIETVIIPGIDSVQYSAVNDIVFVNHKRISSNLYHRVFTLDSTPVYTYNPQGEPQKHLEGFVGNILAAQVLDHRELYLCLSSEKNHIYIWNFNEGELVGKIDCNLAVAGGKFTIFYTVMAIHEFPLEQRYQLLEDVLNVRSQTSSGQKVDGDTIFTISSNGEILVSALKYSEANKKLNWVPLKSMNIKYSEEDKQDKRKQIQMNIQSKAMTAIFYDSSSDNLYFADQEANITIIKSALRLSYTKA